MTFTILSVFTLFFPLAMFLGGAYIVYRGMNSKKGALSGVVSSATAFESFPSKQKCVYYETVVEYYSGAPKQWKEAIVIKPSLERAEFVISGKTLGVSKAVFEISNRITYKGYVSSRFRGVVGAFMEYTNKTAPVEIALEIMHSAGLRDQDDFVSRNEYLPDEIISSLISKPGSKELAKHFGKPLRIHEYIIPLGAKVYTSGSDGSSPAEIVISDTDIADASARERMIVRIAIGGGLIVLSLMISVLILLS